MDPDEVKAAIEAVFRAAQPCDDDVIAWNQDRQRRQLSSRRRPSDPVQAYYASERTSNVYMLSERRAISGSATCSPASSQTARPRDGARSGADYASHAHDLPR